MQIGQTELTVVRGSVLESDTDAIVNAANKGMRGGNALDGAIHRAAGAQMLRELESAAPNGAQTAEVVVTRGYNLPQSWVFHVAGPVYHPNRDEECTRLLAQSYRNCLEEAHRRDLTSLAFPSLSTGVYSFPIEAAAPLALQTAVEWLRQNPQTPLRRVIFAMFGGLEWHHFERASRKWETARHGT